MFKTKKKLYTALEKADKIIRKKSEKLETLEKEYKEVNDELIELKNYIELQERESKNEDN